MNRLLVAGIAGLAMLMTAGFDAQEAQAFGRKCGGSKSCGGGLFAALKAAKDCCGVVETCPVVEECCEVEEPTCCEPKRTRRCGGGLLAKLKERMASCGCPNCSQSTDAGEMEETPSEAPPAPAAEAASSSDAPAA